MRALCAILLTMALFLAFAPQAWASCTSPTGAEGNFVYNTSYSALQYCNGTNWVKIGNAGAATSDSISGSYTASNANVNLATVGTGDWYKWPENVHKSSGGSQISSLSGTGTTYTDDPRTFSWTGGTPTASGSKTTGTFQPYACYSFSAPASTTTHVLYIYIGVYEAQGLLKATLSDAPSSGLSSYVDTSLDSTGQYGYYTLTYNAASAGQTINVTWCLIKSYNNGNVSINGAAYQ